MPLAVDLFCGLGGWAEGLLAEGYEVVGFDIERHRYPERILPDRVQKGAPGIKLNGLDISGSSVGRSFNYTNECEFRDAPLTGRWAEYPGQLVIQDVLTLHGSQFRDAALIVASPPCQEYSYMAMPWKLAKAKAAAIRADTTGQKLADLNRLFEACFRIQKEASFAAGRHIPMVVENVRGAQPWVGRARWNFGSYYLWGDVPALMPFTVSAREFNPDGTAHPKGSWFAIADSKTVRDGQKVPQRIVHVRDGAPHTKHLTNGAEHAGIKNAGCFDGSGRSFQSASVKAGGDWFADGADRSPMRHTYSGTPARKAASAMIAKIPEALSRHIAAVYR